jgi:benzoyl-CoA reductase/2-hydroxyglutaryl-CoA dehydratase subunit BcrC/BadD/HgdB
VADTYTSAWCSSLDYLDENDFFNSMVEGYSRIYLNLGVDAMAEEVLIMLDRYKADGLVMHSNRSCKPYSLGQYDIQRIVQKKAEVPVLIMEADMCDSRNFSESQIQTRIEAFMEVVGSGLNEK